MYKQAGKIQHFVIVSWGGFWNLNLEGRSSFRNSFKQLPAELNRNFGINFSKRFFQKFNFTPGNYCTSLYTYIKTCHHIILLLKQIHANGNVFILFVGVLSESQVPLKSPSLPHYLSHFWTKKL